MVDLDTTTRTRITTPGAPTAEQSAIRWVLQIAHHVRPHFIGRRFQLPIGAEVLLGRGARIFAFDEEESPFQDQDISRGHLMLRAEEKHLCLKVAGKNGVKVGLQQYASASTTQVDDGAVISIAVAGGAILLIVRRTSAQEQIMTHPEIVGISSEIMDVIRKIGIYAHSSVPILLRGESGSGKDLVARALHRAGGGDLGNYRAVNCAELREETLQSELFGHTKGAFTGATADRKGLAELAREGTLFLDEVAEATPTVQAMLLRFLQDKAARRMGSDDVRVIDTRIVCASNASFEDLIHAKLFRKDLYYRIRGAAIEIPPLRKRLDDLPALAEHFLRKCVGHGNRPMSYKLVRRLLCHSWPGNIRELQSIIETAVAESQNNSVIGISEEVEMRLEESRRIEGRSNDPIPTDTSKMIRHSTPSPSLQQVDEAMNKCQGNVAAAASELGVHRQRIYEVLAHHGLTPNGFRKKS